MKNKTFNKKRAFIIFTDLDRTFIPMGLKDASRFINLVKEIERKENVEVKFCPISGRPADFVLGQMTTFSHYFQEAGLKNVIRYGAGEQGGILLDYSEPYKHNFLGDLKNFNFKQRVLDALSKSRYKEFVASEDGKRFTCTLHIKSRIKAKLTDAQALEIISGLKNELSKSLGNIANFETSYHSLEIMPKEINKAKAVQKILSSYQKSYDIVGMSYSGDAENDKSAINYLSKLAEIPGCKANVFLPSNADECIQSKSLEQWKERLRNVSSDYRILKGPKPFFSGVMDLMEAALKKGRLTQAPRKEKLETKDVLALLKM